MPLLWLALGGLIAYFVFVEHNGDFSSALSEIGEKIAEFYGNYMESWASPAYDKVINNKVLLVIVIVVVIGLAVFGTVWGIRAARPEQVPLVAGLNLVPDNCGNEVPVYVVNHETAQDRVEVTPKMVAAGAVYTVQKRGSAARCLREIKLGTE